MSKRLNNEMTADDLLMLPDIDGIVKDIKGQQTVSSQPKSENAEPSSGKDGGGALPPSTGSDSWDIFLRCSEGYDYRVKKVDRKVYPIDMDIIDTLKQCDINKMSTATMINSILRAFIEQNKNQLREHISRNRILI